MESQIQLDAVLLSLSKAGLLPSPVIPPNFKPTVRLDVAFNERSILAGSLFRAGECKSAPSVSFTPETVVKEESRYTLMLVDPDAPTPDNPKFAYWRHWVVSNIKSSSTSSQLSSGNILTEYLGPGPKDESKPHRYLFLLFKEPEGLSLRKEDVGGEEFVQRRSFAVKEWVEKNTLVLVGVNWMLGAGDGWKE